MASSSAIFLQVPGLAAARGRTLDESHPREPQPRPHWQSTFFAFLLDAVSMKNKSTQGNGGVWWVEDAYGTV